MAVLKAGSKVDQTVMSDKKMAVKKAGPMVALKAEEKAAQWVAKKVV